MSHASLLVVLEKSQADDVETVEELVAEQMRPFDENGQWFRAGSRWDWWQIGGRWSGQLNGGDIIRRKEAVLAEFPKFYATLRNKRWNEVDRLGFFGLSASTECERAGKKAHRCLVRDHKSGAAIVSWNDDSSWDEKFVPRFVRDLDPDAILVAVDYHV